MSVIAVAGNNLWAIYSGLTQISQVLKLEGYYQRNSYHFWHFSEPPTGLTDSSQPQRKALSLHCSQMRKLRIKEKSLVQVLMIRKMVVLGLEARLTQSH